MMEFFKFTHEVEDIFGDEEYFHRTLEGAKANADELIFSVDVEKESIPEWIEVPVAKHIVWERTIGDIFQRIEPEVMQD